MKGLILKDFLFEKQNLKTLLLFSVVFLIISLTSDHAFSFTFIMPFIAIMTCITTFNYDEYNHWDGYMSSFPITRKEIVRSKYIFTIIMMFVAIIFTLILYMGIGVAMGKTLEFSQIIEQSIGGILGISIFLSFLYPCIYKYGVEKGRIAIFTVAFGIGGIGYLLSYLIGKLNISASLTFFIKIFEFTDQFWYFVFPLLSTLILYISYFVSVRFYQKKEF